MQGNGTQNLQKVVDKLTPASRSSRLKSPKQKGRPGGRPFFVTR
jgi:hypothetical protein